VLHARAGASDRRGLPANDPTGHRRRRCGEMELWRLVWLRPHGTAPRGCDDAALVDVPGTRGRRLAQLARAEDRQASLDLRAPGAVARAAGDPDDERVRLLDRPSATAEAQQGRADQ